VTIPVHIRRLLGVKPGDRVEFRLENGHVVVAPAQSIVERTKGIFKSNRPPLSAERERELTEIAIAEEVVRRSGLKR
jgi:AbrB family looped-hinge helix DNA binding protein